MPDFMELELLFSVRQADIDSNRTQTMLISTGPLYSNKYIHIFNKTTINKLWLFETGVLPILISLSFCHTILEIGKNRQHICIQQTSSKLL